MITKEFKGKRISALGLGVMRMPVIDGNDAKIDVNASKEMIVYAMENGINYYDTAWGYHSGNSETLIGEILSKYPRESYYLASKFPGYDLSNMDKVEEIFEKQLEKCKVDYFDFYMFHNVCEMNIDGYLDEKYGVFEYLMEQKKNGRIKHLGFSTHGSLEIMERFLEAYGSDMEFCQIQLNWLDYEFQNAKEKIEMLKKYNIPVWVMEPLRGGKLATLPNDKEEVLKKYRNEKTSAWAFRFLQGIPEVVVTLSGMSNMEQLKENIEVYQNEKVLTKEEKNVLLDFAREMTSKNTLPCTACKYCVSHCPMEINIPQMIELYNEHNYTGGGFIAPMAMQAISADKQPSACIGCKSCEAVCPQQIRIADMMEDFAGKLG